MVFNNLRLSDALRVAVGETSTPLC